MDEKPTAQPDWIATALERIAPMLKTSVRVLTKPGERTFADELNNPSATLSTALAWILAVGVIAALLDILAAALIDMWVIPPDKVEFSDPSKFVLMVINPINYLRFQLLFLYQQFTKMYGWLWLHSGLIDLVGNHIFRAASYISYEFLSWQQDIAKGLLKPVSFSIRTGIYYCIATLLGGRGQFGRYAYFLAAIAVPITFIESFLDFMPLTVARLVAVLPGSSLMIGQNWYYTLYGSVTFAASCVVLVYWLILFYFSTKVEHRLTWWRAVIAVVISYLVLFVLRTIWPHGFSGLLEAARMSRWE